MTWPNASDQLTAVFSAPIPFFLTVFVVCAVMLGFFWRAMEWRYRGIIDLWKTMHTQAAVENQIIGSRLADTKASLEAVEASEKKLAALAQQSPPVVKALGPPFVEALAEISQATATAGNQVVLASTANEALTDALRRAPTAYELEPRIPLRKSRVTSGSD
jgi:hypothetical protein